ncbi:DEAD/DEAH box helicase [Kribbella solani]|uniref:Superfamily II DNA or RNA helicase n=1 Tax=Kribbella solani TaxID=236067 RepID=A0A841DT15_9ACTN|nr:DEAD/DEAH box helicase [Kribbella solani]MBB5979870.1 superfamily II DNA or RNA helicase [Kribbella solani]
MRLVLLQGLSGHWTAVIRREVLDWLVARPALATSVVAEHVQVAKLPQPLVTTRTHGQTIQAQVSLQLANTLMTGDWRSGKTRRAAEHFAHVSLLAKLSGAEAPEPNSCADNTRSEPAGVPRLWSSNRAVTAVHLGDQLDALKVLLSKHWDLLYDVEVCPSNAQLLLLPPDRKSMDRDLATIGVRSRRHRVQRTILRPGQPTETLDGLRVDLSEAVPLLVAATDQAGWAQSAQLLAEIAQAAATWVAEGCVVPTIREAHVYTDQRPSWRVGPLTGSQDKQLLQWGRNLERLPSCMRNVSGTPELANGAETVREFVDATVEHLASDVEQWCARHQFALPRLMTSSVNDNLQDWTDDLEAGSEGILQSELILRIDAPDFISEQSPVHAVLLFRNGSGKTVAADDVWRGVAERPINDPRLRLRVRCLLRHAGRRFPPLRALGNQYRPGSLLIGLDYVAALRGRVSDDLADLGVSVEWRGGWLTRLKPRVLVGPPTFAPEPDGSLGLSQLLDRRWQLTLDGDLVTDDEMILLSHAVMPFVQLRNRWVLVDDWTRQKARHPQMNPVERASGALQAQLGVMEIDGRAYACTPTDGLAYLLDKLAQSADEDDRRDTSIPDYLCGLHKHQRHAVYWLERISRFGINGLLADDMGVGKTISALGFHRSPARPDHDRPTLVVCSAGGLVQKWCDDAAALMPDLQVLAYWGRDRRIPPSFSGVVITTYGTLVRDQEELAANRWGLVIADEAQRIKNPKTKAVQAIRRIRSTLRLALSGTPLENHPRELWAILEFLNPGLFGTQPRFESRFVSPLRQLAGTEGEQPHRQRIHQMMSLVMLRRTKTDPTILPGLPARQDFMHRIGFSDMQRSLLEALGIDTENQFSLSKSLRLSGVALLRLIEACRQVCNSPAQYRGDPASSIATDPRGAAIEAPKLARLGEILTDATRRGESALVFTPYAVMANLINAYLAGIGLESFLYHGSVSPSAKRKALIAIKSEQARVLVVTVGSGGVGLDLVRPNHVVHYDRTWSPAKEDQASDRVHRMGQRRDVKVHHLFHAHSIEEHIAAKHTNKRRYADHFLPTLDATAPRLSPRELANLFGLDTR